MENVCASCRRYDDGPEGTLVALQGAIKRGHTQCVEVLAKRNVNVNRTTIADSLVIAVGNGHGECVESFLNLGVVDGKSECWGTALIKVIRAGYFDIAKILINLGAEVNRIDRYSRTALMEASKKGNVDLADLLIKSGAAVDAKNAQDESALTLAIANGHVHLLDLLVKSGGDVNIKTKMCNSTVLIEETILRHEGTVHRLVQLGADVNAKDNLGRSALHEAIGRNYETIVNMLVESGSDVNMTDQNRRTALIKAVYFKKFKICKILLKYPCDMNKRDQSGLTVLMHAGTEEFVRLLLRNGAPVNSPNGINALMHYLQWFRTCREIVKLLLVAGEKFQSDSTQVFTLCESLIPRENTGTLKHLCRESIRGHLLEVDCTNLFCRVPLLGLPSLIQKYLLYWVELGEEQGVNVYPTMSSAVCENAWPWVFHDTEWV